MMLSTSKSTCRVSVNIAKELLVRNRGYNKKLLIAYSYICVPFIRKAVKDYLVLTGTTSISGVVISKA